MGRAARKGKSKTSLRHWTDTHPDRDMWSPARLAIARTQTREEYEALYGRGSGFLFQWQEGDEEVFLVQPEPGRYTDPEKLMQDYTGSALPLLRSRADGSFYLEGYPSGEMSLDINRTRGLLDALERELGPAPLPGSWLLAEEGSGDWYGPGLGSENLALEGSLSPQERRQYISSWLERMEPGEEISVDRDGGLVVRRTAQGFEIEAPWALSTSQGSEVSFVSSTAKEAGDRIEDIFADYKSMVLGAEWKLGDRTLYGRHEDAFIYVGGPPGRMLADISSQEPRGGQIEAACRVRFENEKAHIDLAGELSRSEAVLLRNTLASLMMDSELFDG